MLLQFAVMMADSASLFLSVLTIGETRKGIELKRLVDADAAFGLGNGLMELSCHLPTGCSLSMQK
jgi:hypothetical protein